MFPAVFVLIPLVWCVVTYYMVYRVAYSHWVPIITHVWLLYYYVSLALRENILLVVRVGSLVRVAEAMIVPHNGKRRLLLGRTGLGFIDGGFTIITSRQ